MSKQSYEYTDMIGMLRVVDEAGPISALDMVGDFRDVVKRGYVGSDGLLTLMGKKKLYDADKGEAHGDG